MDADAGEPVKVRPVSGRDILPVAWVAGRGLATHPDLPRFFRGRLAQLVLAYAIAIRLTATRWTGDIALTTHDRAGLVTVERVPGRPRQALQLVASLVAIMVGGTTITAVAQIGRHALALLWPPLVVMWDALVAASVATLIVVVIASGIQTWRRERPLAAYKPPPPYWRASLLTVDPKRQGEGLARALGTAAIGQPALGDECLVLIAASTELADRYTQHGFRQIAACGARVLMQRP